MANIWSSAFSIINRSYFWCISSYKSFKNSTSRGSTKIKIFIFLIIFSACTIGGEESQGVVTIDSTTAITVAEQEITFEEGVLNFAQCMREEGINFPDPTFDIDGNPQFDGLEIENEDEFEIAFENCEDILRLSLIHI